MPKYLSDQDGAFEVLPCAGRSGRCFEQLITEKPIPWGSLPDPFSLAGDVAWSDYTVAADFAMGPTGAVTLMGRIDSADVFQGDKVIYPSSYILSVQTDGAWKLVSTAYKKSTVTLASGTAAVLPGEWHRFALTFHGNVISALLDGKQLANIGDNSHTHGMVAVGTGWNMAQFDNLSVTQ